MKEDLKKLIVLQRAIELVNKKIALMKKMKEEFFK